MHHAATDITVATATYVGAGLCAQLLSSQVMVLNFIPIRAVII